MTINNLKKTLTKYFYTISFVVSIVFLLINIIQTRKLRSEILVLKNQIHSLSSSNKNQTNLNTSNIFDSLENNVTSFFNFMKTIEINRNENNKRVKEFKNNEIKRLDNLYSIDEEKFFNEFETLLEIERIK
jgi:hypothetical protein